MQKKKKGKSKALTIILLIVIVIAVALGAKSVMSSLKKNKTDINLNDLSSDTATLSCAVFDGTEVFENSTVVIEDGVISQKSSFKNGLNDSDYLLMPGLIDAHAHLTTKNQMEQLVKNGVTTVCDVSASKELEESYDVLNVWSSRTSVWLSVDNAKAFVEDTIKQGGKYVKVVADLPEIMGGSIMDKAVLDEIVKCAHENNLKVAVHAISVAGVQMAVDSGVDLLIHVPIGETFPKTLAQQIAQKNIAVMPTMGMMQAFANSILYGYEKEDYEDAKAAVKLLHSLNVPILVATDSSDSFFVPQLEHGKALHTEMQLLVDAGLTPLEVLQAATTNVAKAFEISDVGVIAPNMKATMILVHGRPDKEITDSTEIVQIWVDGKPILEVDESKAYIENEAAESSKSDEIILINKEDESMSSEELKFYPKHPSNLKTHKIETKAMPILKQDAPFEAKSLCGEFCKDLDSALSVYQDKRFEVTGVATKIGPDIHNKPSIEISDEVCGQCYTLCIFPSDDFYSKVAVGDIVTVRANYLVMSNWYGVVMKYSELIDVKAQ